MNKTPKIGIEGYIGMRVVTAEGKERWTNIDPKTGKGPKNLIVDDGLNMLGDSTALNASRYCRVGTSNTAPANSQSDLVARHGSVSNIAGSATNSNSGTSPWWHESSREYQFNAGTIDGAALAEVGFFENNNTGDMFSRNLIKDGVGTPTTITLTSSEILYVTYVIRVNVPNTDSTGTFQINSEDYNYTIRAANASNLNIWGVSSSHFNLNSTRAFATQTLGAITTIPSGTSYNGTGSTTTYVDLSLESQGNVTFSDSQGNTGSGIGSLAIGTSTGSERWQISIDKVSDGSTIDKDNTKTLTMNNFFKVSWDRV